MTTNSDNAGKPDVDDIPDGSSSDSPTSTDGGDTASGGDPDDE